MNRKKPSVKSQEEKPFRWANTVEGRERQMIGLAYDRVGEKMLNGTATSQELVFFLKLGTTKERVEREILEREKELITAKTEALKSQKHIEELYADAIKAFGMYRGDDGMEEDEE